MKWEAKLLLVAVTVGGFILAKLVDEDKRSLRGWDDREVSREIIGW